jgi:hypothetical protein
MQVVVAGALTAGRIASIGDDTDTVIGCAALRRVPPIAVASWFGADGSGSCKRYLAS